MRCSLRRFRVLFPHRCPLIRPFQLCARLFWRIYARTVREIDHCVRMREPPNAQATLCFLALLASINFFFDSIEHHLVFLSTTVYPHSAIYEPHTVVSLINAEDYGWGRAPLRLRRALICSSNNGTHTRLSLAKVRWAYQPVGLCKWTAYIAVCQSLPNLRELFLGDTTANSRQVQIPFRMAYSARRLAVAACFSPLFYMERWQIVLSTLEIYRNFGVQLQVFYIQSILASIMEVMELYRQRGEAELEPWPSIELDPESESRVGFDPNTELDWRNQASAHTDCLLKYKEVTEFIIVGDLDDVLIPRLGTRYINEFHLLSIVYPNAAGFIYDRFNTELEAAPQAEDYSLVRLIESAHVSDQKETGKYVVNTSRVETAWLHYPGIKSGWTKMFEVPTNLNIMVHLRNWTIGRQQSIGEERAHAMQKRKRRRTPHEGTTRNHIKEDNNDEGSNWRKPPTSPAGGGHHVSRMSQLFSARQLSRMESSFARLLSSHASLFRRLPTAQNYLPMMVECYNRIFYSRKNRMPNFCPGPVKCELAQVAGLHCKVAKMRMAPPRQISWRTIVHVPEGQFQFVSRHNGCTLR